jgi:simple sugar transport system permease protein
MFDGLFTAAAPLMLAGLGALVSELAGVLGIFVEGFMTLGSFFAWILAGWTGSIFLGTLITAAGAALIGWGLARFVHNTGANPFIAGLALNLAAGGITDSLSIVWFGTKGVLRNPAIRTLAPLKIPALDSIPVVGKIFSGQLPFTWVAWGAIILGAVIIGRTPMGLRLRAAGRSPEAAADRGIRADKYREGAWAAAAFLAALAGAALIFRIGAYTPGGVAGRGWISLAAVYLGFRRVWGVALAALVFALAERIGFGAQTLSALPATVLLGLPSALALVLYTVSQRLALRKTPGADLR